MQQMEPPRGPLRVPSVRISLQPIITASYARCLHILPLFAHILSTLSVSVAVTRPLTDTALWNSELTSGSVHFLNVVCTHPERCLHTIILSALSPSIAVNPPARCLAFSACPSQSLS